MLWTRTPLKAAQPICHDDVWRPNRRRTLVCHCLCLPPLPLAFCNGNQRFVLNRHWQRWADCLRSEISKDLYRAAVMSPKLEMRAVEQLLFTISVILSLFCQGTLLNHPSTPRSWHPHGAPLPTASSDALPPPPTPAFLFPCFDVLPRNLHTWSAGELCDRAIHSSFTVSCVINSQVQNSGSLWH